MNNDRNPPRDTDITDESMRDRNVTGKDMRHQQQGGTQTTQRSKTERGDIGSSDELEDDAIRSEIGAGE